MIAFYGVPSPVALTFRNCYTFCMQAKAESSVSFTTKGQVVIPVQLRRLYGIESGTRAVVKATSEGILLQPVTQALIESGCGMLPRTSKGGLKEERALYKMQERKVEERRARRRP